MDAKGLVEIVKKYEDAKEYINNEETVKMALVVPFIRLLGYDPNNPKEVRLEYSAPFTQGDGKRLPDRMDYVIFDSSGQNPLFVIEAKDLGVNLKANSQQLARYIAQMNSLHFGIITDGCTYLFFGDLEQPNIMDREPFFSFSLSDEREDWTKVASFLEKFSRHHFNSETLLIDAENSRYRRSMIDKLTTVLKQPSNDEDFMKWLTSDIYPGKRTASVMARLATIAKDAVEPALLRVLGRSVTALIEKKFEEAENHKKDGNDQVDASSDVYSTLVSDDHMESDADFKRGVITTEEEMNFYNLARQLCVSAGYAEDDIICRDTTNYFNVSYRKPTKWFIRFFGDSKRKALVTLVPVDEAKRLSQGFEVEPAPATFGASRIYIDSIAQLEDLNSLVIRSLQILCSAKSRVIENTQEDNLSI